MDSTLRPMSTAQVLDRTFLLYRKNFLLFAGLGAVLPTMNVLLQVGFRAMGFSFDGRPINDISPRFIVLMLSFFSCLMLVYVIGHAIAAGATVYAVSRVHLEQSVSMAEAYKKVLSRLWTVLVIVVLVFMCTALVAGVGGGIGGGIGGVIMGVFIAAMGRGGGPATVVFTMLGVVVFFLLALAGASPGIYLYLRWCLAVPVAISEGSGIFDSLGRSFSLAAGAILRLFLIYLLAVVIGYVIGLVFAIPAQILITAYPGKYGLLAFGIQQLGAFIGGVVVGPIAPIAVALVYYDQRVRKEAFDLHLMIQAVEQAAPAPAAPTPPLG